MKRQTFILVIIGLVLFIAGGGIAFATVVAGTKTHSGGTVASVNSPVVVATSNIPAGTTGQTIVAQGLASIRLIPQKDYATSDLTSVQGLSDEVLTSSVKKGEAIQAGQLTPSVSTISLPKGDDGITISMGGVAGMAGYLQPGSDVDVYANITKLSASTTTPSNIPLPCTELVMSNIEVLDVSNVVPPLGGSSTAGGRTAPTNLTLLLAVTPNQARLLSFMTANESLSVTQTQKGAGTVAVGTCIGTGQTTVAP